MKHSGECVEDKICNNCRMRKWREDNKELDAYRNLQTSARKRKLPFKISFNQFLDIIEGTEYIEKKGNGPKNLTIDRDNNLLGYVPGNCFVRSKRANVQKFHKKDLRRKKNGRIGKAKKSK